MRAAHAFRTLLLLVLFVTNILQAQDDPPKPGQPKIPKIADEPRTVDPATLMPAKLAAVATVDFSDSSLREVVEWLRTEQEIVVLVDKNRLSEIGVLPSEPISDRLDDAPIYLLLNRLRSLELAWYYQDDILHITSADVAEERLTTVPYNVGDLLDAGYDLDGLATVIQIAIAADTWEEVGGPGVLSFLGDVMFVRQADTQQRELQGLLTALRKHARQTFILDPPQHLVLRQSLRENVSVDFRDTPLKSAIEQLGQDAKVDIRLNVPALRRIRVREREPVTLKLTERKLETVLEAILLHHELTWILRDGVMWITSQDEADSLLKSAVYDVRDLCRDHSESDALAEALISQTEGGWDEMGGPGSLIFARPGVMVVSHQESVQMEVLQLLDTYRAALRASKPRERNVVDPQEVITVYYRLHANMAENLASLLPNLVQPESWKAAARPEASGEVTLAASPPDLFSDEGRLVRSTSSSDPAKARSVVVSRAVLIVRQSRANHDEIAKVIRRLESGDLVDPVGGGGGGGFGGFGGGFLSISPMPLRATKHGKSD